MERGRIHGQAISIRSGQRRAQSRRKLERIRIEHIRPDAGEVRLWVPDQVLGAIGDMFVGAEGTGKWSKHWDEIDPHVTLLMATLL